MGGRRTPSGLGLQGEVISLSFGAVWAPFKSSHTSKKPPLPHRTESSTALPPAHCCTQPDNEKQTKTLACHMRLYSLLRAPTHAALFLSDIQAAYPRYVSFFRLHAPVILTAPAFSMYGTQLTLTRLYQHGATQRSFVRGTAGGSAPSGTRAGYALNFACIA